MEIVELRGRTHTHTITTQVFSHKQYIYKKKESNCTRHYLQQIFPEHTESCADRARPHRTHGDSKARESAVLASTRDRGCVHRTVIANHKRLRWSRVTAEQATLLRTHWSRRVVRAYSWISPVRLPVFKVCGLCAWFGCTDWPRALAPLSFIEHPSVTFQWSSLPFCGKWHHIRNVPEESRIYAKNKKGQSQARALIIIVSWRRWFALSAP